MHAALKTNDILREVFTYIRQDPSAAKRSKDAYHAALVCRQFLPHALDALWFSLDDMRPLLSLIPPAKVVTLDSGASTLRGVLRQEDLSTFDLYAHRVREIHQVNVPHRPSLKVDVIMNLLECLGRRFLFPNLRVLRINPLQDGLRSIYCFVICPNLERLEIFDASDNDLHHLLHWLVRTAPSLRHFKTMIRIPSNIMHLTGHLPKLQSLDSWNEYAITPSSFATSIPFAEHITTWSVGSLSIAPIKSLSANIRFPILTSLEILGHRTADEISQLFSHSLFPKLQKFTFNSLPYNYRPETSGLYKQSWLKLCSLLFTKQLKFLFVRQDEDDFNHPVEETQIPLEDFFPHVKTETAHPLTTFWMGEPRLLAPLTNSSIDRLCTAFPNLTHLYLHFYASTLTSFDIVALLAQRVPQLKSLDIGIDGSALANPPTVPILSHRLTALCLQNSVIGNPLIFAHYIDRLFPFTTIELSPLPEKGEDVISAIELVRDCRKDQAVRGL